MVRAHLRPPAITTFEPFVMIDKLAIISGSGQLPEVVINHCQRHKIDFHIIGFKGITPKSYQRYPSSFMRITDIGQVIASLRSCQVSHLTMVGAVPRARIIFSPWLDKTGRAIVADFIKSSKHGDNALLSFFADYLYKHTNVKVVAPHIFLDEVIVEQKIYTDSDELSSQEHHNISYAISALNEISRFDIGQSLLIDNRQIIAMEGARGTNQLLHDYGKYLGKYGQCPWLVKACKLNQTDKADWPTIGYQTIKNASKYGLRGIAISSEDSFFLQQQQSINLANKHKIKIVGF